LTIKKITGKYICKKNTAKQRPSVQYFLNLFEF